MAKGTCITVILLTVVGLSFGYADGEQMKSPVFDKTLGEGTFAFVPDSGFVPDEATAIAIAEAIWLPIYGERILDMKPFTAELQDDSIWVVKGTLNQPFRWPWEPSVMVLGGVPYAWIRKSNAEVLGVIHTQ